jgi:molybdopterin-dependent oxidoreductase alpha subunit
VLAVIRAKTVLIRMARPRVNAAGGLPALVYVWKKGREAGGVLRLYRRLRRKNVCKTCALGMGGQAGGMVNEAGHFPEVCKKSVQAQAGDMHAAISEDLFARMSIDDLGRLTPAQIERLGRLVFPVMAGATDTHFRRISWDEALQRAGNVIHAAPPEHVFFYSSGRSSNEAAYLFQLIARAFGTSNIHNCSFYCHAASGVALSKTVGTGTSTVVLDDLAKADLALVAGANPASNHPRLISQLVQLRRRGGTVIVINPIKELGLTRFRVPSDWRSMLFGSTVSDIYLQPHVGSDVAVFKALLKGVVESDGVDQSFVTAHTSGWESVFQDIRSASWDDLLGACGLSRTDVNGAIAALVRAKRGIFLWAMGLTHHDNGVDNILALSNLALARGWVGGPGAGLLPIRGHSNVQGVGTVGVSPAVKKAFAQKLEEVYGITVPSNPGQDTYASMVAAYEGKIQTAILLGGNLFSSNPDREWAATALRRIPFSLSITTKLNEGHIHGRGQTSIILPILARDEEFQPTTQESMFNYVRLSDGGIPAVAGEMRSEVEVLAELAERILPSGRFDWKALKSHRHLRQEMARVVPELGEIADIETTGREFQIRGRSFHVPDFGTPDKRAQFHVTPLPPEFVRADQYRLTTIRSEGQFNTVVYEEEDLYRGNLRRDVVMMSASDAAAENLREGDGVTVRTTAGTMHAHVAIIDIAPGNIAMYYPEANVLVPRRIDLHSKTPAFKSIPAEIVKST